MGREGKRGERGGPQFKKNDPPPVIRWLVTGLGEIHDVDDLTICRLSSVTSYNEAK